MCDPACALCNIYINLYQTIIIKRARQMDKEGFKILLFWVNAGLFSLTFWIGVMIWLWRVL